MSAAAALTLRFCSSRSSAASSVQVELLVAQAASRVLMHLQDR
jgi:hypothetical protein